MKCIRMRCPAKINLTLEVVNKREDGFHNIKSIMQAISLYDYISIVIDRSSNPQIKLSGTSEEIPYNEKNIVYKAVELYLKENNIDDYTVHVFIEKNIPVSAGLAGGSTDAAGTLCGLHYVFGRLCSDKKINEMCASLGSDLNFCLRGGRALATSRGEIIKELPFTDSELTLIKPKNLGISAGEAYKKYALKEFKPQNNMTEKMLEAINLGEDIKPYLYNDLEYAIFDDYEELQKIKTTYPDSIMSGSGSTYFALRNIEKSLLDNTYQFINNLKFISGGVEAVKYKNFIPQE